MHAKGEYEHEALGHAPSPQVETAQVRRGSSESAVMEEGGTSGPRGRRRIPRRSLLLVRQQEGPTTHGVCSDQLVRAQPLVLRGQLRNVAAGDAAALGWWGLVAAAEVHSRAGAEVVRVGWARLGGQSARAEPATVPFARVRGSRARTGTSKCSTE